MAITGRRVLAVGCVLGMVLLGPRLLLSCGPFFARAVFTYTVHPDFPLERFAAGALGVLQPTYARSYLVVAYRYLIGSGFDATEQNALVALWRERLVGGLENDTEAWTKTWLEARQSVPGSTTEPTISVFRYGSDFSSYLNCPADAFNTAARTLHRLQARFGADSAAVRAWVQTQDIVFAKCSDGADLSLPPATVPELQAEQAYQTAAAHFYSGNFDAASSAFAAIAQDPASPWQTLAPYLVARAWVRKATLSAAAGQVDQAVLTQAAAQVQKILQDSALHALHPAARRLQQYIRFRLEPAPRLHELAQAVLKQGAGETLQQDLADYTLLLDKYLEGQSDEQELAYATLPAILKEDALSDWLLTFQATDDAALTHALAQWETTSALPWLVVALSKIDATHAKAARLLQASASLPATSPAFATVALYRARLLLQASKQDEVRTYLDTVLPHGQDAFPPSAFNLLRAVRMQVARNLEEFLTYAQRFPAGITYDEDGRELPVQLFGMTMSDTSETLPAAAMLSHFDDDATLFINLAMPLSMRKNATVHPTLPAHLRRDLTLATWVAAALFDQVAVAQELAPRVVEQIPELQPWLDAYLMAATPEAKKFAAVFLLLKYPGTRPYLASGLGRATPLEKIDDFRDNWWCAWQDKNAVDEVEPGRRQNLPGLDSLQGRVPDFLSAAEKTAAQTESQTLRALVTGPNYLVAQVLAWAKRMPDDPRVPEALHLAVRSTRYGCTDDRTSQFSKQAFQLLHKQYPKSPWAQKTKYWY